MGNLATALVRAGTVLLTTIALAGHAWSQRGLEPVRSGDQGSGARIALVMGNGAYKNTSLLANPPGDARLMADTLASLGFQLVGGRALVNADKPAMERAIREFGQRLRGSSVGLFYYAGHGVQVRGENFLIPVSANVTSESDVKYELVNAGFVLDEMTSAGTRLNMVILDACRNNPFGERGLRSASRGLAQISAPAGTVISYATQPGNTAADGTGRNSPYTTALAAAMRKPGLGVFDVFNDVGLAVKNATGGVQQPWLATSPIEGSFQFVAGASPPVPPAPVAGASPAFDPTANERAFWESIKASNSADEFNAYLAQYPNGIFAALAQARLKALQSTAVAAAVPAQATPSPPAVAVPTKLVELESESAMSESARQALKRGDPFRPCAECASVVLYCRKGARNRFDGITVGAPTYPADPNLSTLVSQGSGRLIAYRSLRAAVTDAIGEQIDCAIVRAAS